MAPIEPDTSNSNILPLALFAFDVVSVGGIITIVGRVLHRAYIYLPPSQAVRVRESNRRRHVQIFLSLAAISLGVAWYHALNTAIISYDAWATTRGVALPNALFGEGGALGNGENNVELQLGWWFRDTSLILDAAEIAIESSRRFWWTQQTILSASAWAVFVGAEGHRRNIPHLWAFVLLGQMVSISFAQNLFCLAALLTPVPLSNEGSHHLVNYVDSTAKVTPSKALRFSSDTRGGLSRFERIRNSIKTYFTPKPLPWTPHPLLHLVPLTITFVCVFLLPFVVGSSFLMPLLSVPYLHCYLHVLIPWIVPMGWGYSHASSKNAQRTYLQLFKFIAIMSLLLHIKATTVALLDNTPESYRHRHSILFFKRDEQRSTLQRGSTAVSNVFGAINDHPAVAYAGWDVLLCGVTVIIWATVRGLDAQAMLEVCVPFYRRGLNEKNGNAVANGAKARRHSQVKGSSKSSSTSTPVKRKPRRSNATGSEDDFIPQDTEEETTDLSIEGEEDVKEDPEAGALAWGLTALGGLGAGSASVWGVEVSG